MLDTLTKCPTGGLDTITGSGLPRGRPTLICGNSGSGKTLFGMEFLIRGKQCGEYGEKSIYNQLLRANYDHEVINAYQQAELARDQRRMVGDLSDEEKVIFGLGLIPEESSDAGSSNDAG